MNCVTVDTASSNRILTTAYDGSSRVTDLNKLDVQNIYEIEETCRQDYLTYHAQQDPNTLLITAGNGSLTRVDMRDCSSQQTYQLDQKKSVKFVTVHPVQNNYFATATSSGLVCLWDARNLKKFTPVCSFPHSRTVASVHFSPVTGNTLLTSCLDNRIRVLDNNNFTSLSQQRAIRHNNHTGRWLTTIKPNFLPSCDESFITGSVDSRALEVYDVASSTSPEFLLHGEDMTTYATTTACHPHRLLVAGGNSSGKCYIFR